ncbi:MAG: Hsp20/alpha crystallin family protein [Phycisphaerales bacterium]|nr:Hsp20/alpha crystallin family protein [Phycisphaerales bacterium]
MSARDWESVLPFNEFRREMDRVIDNFVGGVGPHLPFRGYGQPALDVWESPDALHVEADLPGLTMNDVTVQVVGTELSVKGCWSPPQSDNVTYHRRERRHGDFARMVTLPQDVDTNAVNAVLKNGLLCIVLPKLSTAKGRKIPVQGD